MEQAKHDDKEKIPLQWILSMSGLDDVAKVGAYGAKKYGQSNWRGGSEWMRYAGSCVRHLAAFIRGESIDPESGLPHLAHCAYNCLILLSWAKEGCGKDDRPITEILVPSDILSSRIYSFDYGPHPLAHDDSCSPDCDNTDVAPQEPWGEDS